MTEEDDQWRLKGGIWNPVSMVDSWRPCFGHYQSLSLLYIPERTNKQKLPQRSVSSAGRNTKKKEIKVVGRKENNSIPLEGDEIDGSFTNDRNDYTHNEIIKHEDDEIFPHILRPARSSQSFLKTRSISVSSSEISKESSPNSLSCRKARSSSVSSDFFESSSSNVSIPSLYSSPVDSKVSRNKSMVQDPSVKRKPRLCRTSFREIASRVSSPAEKRVSSLQLTEEFWGQYQRHVPETFIGKLRKRTKMRRRHDLQGSRINNKEVSMPQQPVISEKLEDSENPYLEVDHDHLSFKEDFNDHLFSVDC